ncbi:MAG TPA: hypothetical protein PKA95_00405 [Thermomicrobiales bacterium]|nr:hypothetical protein [Thermomicrobiales bacterium]
MVAQGNESTSATPGGNSRADDLAIALDGVRPTADTRAADAYRLSLRYDAAAFSRTLHRLRQWSPQAIAVVSSKMSTARRLLQTIEVPHIAVDSLLDVPKQSSVIVLGCQNADAVPSHALWQAFSRGATVVTSDKSAQTEPLSEVLSPGSPRPARVARVDWTDDTGECIPGIDPPEAPCSVLLYPGVHLPPGYVPISVPMRAGARIDVLAIDSLTGDPLIVRAAMDRGMLVHAVPHWWQQHGLDRTAMDRRRLANIPGFDALGQRAGDITFGEFQAARTMMAGLLRGLRPMLE